MSVERLHMEEIFKIDGYGVIIHFSDGTMAQYTVDELSHMRPNREPAVRVESVDDPGTD